jgi:pteridine reductase
MNDMPERKILLITGAARRIGAAIAALFHARGYDVLIHFNQSEQQAQALVEGFNAQRPNSAYCLQADLCAVSAVHTLAAAALAWRGGIDVLINNASRFYPGALGSVDEAAWDDLFGSNLKGGFFLAQALAPSLKERRGCIINLADIHADGGRKDYPVYSIAKAGVKMMTKALARELAPLVRVNGISPGAILWPEDDQSEKEQSEAQRAVLRDIALQRMGTAEEIAATAWYLAEDAAYSTGQTIRVDGGRTQGTPYNPDLLMKKVP